MTHRSIRVDPGRELERLLAGATLLTEVAFVERV